MIRLTCFIFIYLLQVSASGARRTRWEDEALPATSQVVPTVSQLNPKEAIVHETVHQLEVLPAVRHRLLRSVSGSIMDGIPAEEGVCEVSL